MDKKHLKNKKLMENALRRAFKTGETDAFTELLAVQVRYLGVRNIAEKSGIPERTVHSAIATGANPRLETLAAIMKAVS